MKKLLFLAVATGAFCLSFAAGLFSQGRSVPAQGQVTADVRNAFTIFPLLQEFEARPGQRVKFGFDVESLDHDTKLNVQIVGLRQEESGLILPDETNPPPGNVQLFGPSVIQLRPGQHYSLEGVIVLPLDAANSLSYGILVTDVGRVTETSQKSSRNQVRVRFVTRYLLRVHIDIQGPRAIQSSDLEVLSAELVEEQGNCLARVRVRNPRQGCCDASVRCRLVPESAPALDPAFYLVLPVRRRTDEQIRPVCKILGHSIVTFETVVPHPVTPGDYRLEVDTTAGHFPHVRHAYAWHVDSGQFPNHALAVMQVGGILRVDPAQIELSLKPRGDRLVRVTVTNASRRSVGIELKPMAADGNLLPWAFVRPESFQLPPGANRNVMVGIQQAQGVQTNLYGEISLMAMTSDATVAARRPLPLAVLAPSPSTPEFLLTPVRLADSTQRPALVTEIRNRGGVHLVPQGLLHLVGPNGEKLEISGNFGQWLLPGRTGELQFPFTKLPVPGDYRLSGTILLSPDAAPVVVNQTLEIPAVTTSVSVPAGELPFTPGPDS